MSIDAIRATYADLGEQWLRQQLAKLTQRHIQCGRHFRVDAIAVLANTARHVRAAAVSVPQSAAASGRHKTDLLSADRFRRCSPSEWLAVVGDQTEVIVRDADGAPESHAIAKAVAVLQTRDYLEGLALRLIEPLAALKGAWRLITLDFGAEAALKECEFLMCFSLGPDARIGSKETPYAEVGFAIAGQEVRTPMFIVSLQVVIGLGGGTPPIDSRWPKRA